MHKTVTREQFAKAIGQPLGHSEWMTIDQARIDRFADVTEDRQFIHVDPERAALTPFGGTVAHGFLSLSLLIYLTGGLLVVPEGVAIIVNYGVDKVRFPQPVRAGGAVRANATLTEVTEKGSGRLLLRVGVVVEIEGESKPALVADLLLMAIPG